MQNKEFLSIEELKATFFDEDALLTQPAPIYRLKSKGQRYYYDWGIDGEPRFFVSVTTMIKNTMPTSPQLIKWIADKGYEESQEFAEERANYGTFMHIQIGELLINGTYDLDKLKEKLKAYIEEQKLPSSLIEWEDDLKKDILAFAQFMIDHDVKPLAVEIILTNPEDGYAGAIDLICEMTDEEKGYFGEVYKSGPRAGQPKETKQEKRFRAVVDFKSGRKGFYPEHEIQVHAYKKMWNLNFDQYPLEKVYNWSPKDWKGKTPTYNLKDQTNSKQALKLPYLTELASIERESRTSDIIVPHGLIEPKRGLNNNILSLTLSEIVKEARNRKENKQEPEAEKTIDELMEEEHKKNLDPDFDTKDDMLAEGYESEI